jgi:hypothetical protein
VFLLLGAILNVAVAWGSATTVGFADYVEGIRAHRSSGAGAWMVEVHRKPSAMQVHWTRSTEPAGNYSEGESPADLAPSWLTYSREIEMGCSRELWDAEARGWPWVSLWSRIRGWCESPDGIRQNLTILHGIALPVEPFRGDMSELPKVLPLRPIWPGFAINTIFYAALLWCAWIAAGRIRRFMRVHRHRCPACGYEIAEGVGPRCSECGAALPASWSANAS